MSTTQFTVYLEPGERRDVRVSVHPDRSAYAYCCSYSEQAPILSVSHADISFAVTPPEQSTIGDADLDFARDLAEAANTYLTEISRLHTGVRAESDQTAA